MVVARGALLNVSLVITPSLLGKESPTPALMPRGSMANAVPGGPLRLGEVVHFVKDWSGGEVVVHNVHVGGLANVVEHEPPANAHHPSGHLGFTQPPTGHVQFVNPLVHRLSHSRVGFRNPDKSLVTGA